MCYNSYLFLFYFIRRNSVFDMNANDDDDDEEDEGCIDASSGISLTYGASESGGATFGENRGD